MFQNAFSPVKLKRVAATEISRVMDIYESMGFSFNTHVHILLEAHEDVVEKIILDEEYKERRMKTSYEYAWVDQFTNHIEIPSFLGGYRKFNSKKKFRNDKHPPIVVFLPPIGPKFHSISHKPTVAHELAHVTENINSHLDLV